MSIKAGKLKPIVSPDNDWFSGSPFNTLQGGEHGRWQAERQEVVENLLHSSTTAVGWKV